jgi:trk system potassium uptake protein TrkA
VHVILIGCGRVGSELGSNLERLGHTVTIIDKEKSAFDRLKTGFNGKKIVGYGFDRETLLEAGIKEASAFAAVTNGDNSNILAARVAKEHFRVPHVVARIYDPRRAQIYQRLGIQTVATVRWTTDQMLRHILPDDVPVAYTVDNGEVVITAVIAPHGVVGKRVSTLDHEGRWRVAAVSRFGVPRVPDGDLTIQDGDILYVSAARADAAEIGAHLTKAGQPE